MSISVQELSYIYMKGTPFEKIALDNVSFKIEKGEFVGIIGHTGSGKSTLIQHFNGLLKPEKGRIYINGMDTTGKDIKELRKQVGIVFQYPEHQLFEETVYKEIAFGLNKQNVDRNEAEQRIFQAIKAVGLKEDVIKKSPFELSGGQKRRVAIASVIAMKPHILILDEPTAGLDPRGRDEIFRLVSDMHASSGITIILVSHSMEDVAKLAGRVIVMNRGRIEMDGKTHEVYRHAEKLEKIGLSAPQITYLMKKIKSVVPGINEDVFTVEDAKNEILKYLKRSKKGGGAKYD